MKAGGEAGVVHRAQAGDIAAFEELYRSHTGRVYALCLRMLANARLAEELTQETFVLAWNRLGEFRGESAFSSWVHRIAVNAALAHLRTDRRRLARIGSSEEISEPAREGDEAAHATAIDIEHAIGLLPAQARAVFILHEIEGYQHDEIAVMMNIASGTSKTQLHRARARLREILT
jgi:RNA polymerase sigma-70 factor (ECF subfamily)